MFGGNHENQCRERPSHLFLILQLGSHHPKCRDPSSAPSASTKITAPHSPAALAGPQGAHLRAENSQNSWNTILTLRPLHKASHGALLLREMIEMWMFEGYASLLQLWACPLLLLDDAFWPHQTTAASWTADKSYATFCQKTF